MAHGAHSESLFIKFLLAVVVASCGYTFIDLRDRTREIQSTLEKYQHATRQEIKELRRDLHRWEVKTAPYLNGKGGQYGN